MKTTILTLLALALAIPTYGISLVVWVFIKYKYDSFVARRGLINAAVMSNKYGTEEVRYNVNNASLTMLFGFYHGEVLLDKNTLVIGLLPHPVEGFLMLVKLQQASKNRLLIQSIEVTPEILAQLRNATINFNSFFSSN